jgi:hypothetical protein
VDLDVDAFLLIARENKFALTCTLALIDSQSGLCYLDATLDANHWMHPCAEVPAA